MYIVDDTEQIPLNYINQPQDIDVIFTLFKKIFIIDENISYQDVFNVNNKTTFHLKPAIKFTDNDDININDNTLYIIGDKLGISIVSIPNFLFIEINRITYTQKSKQDKDNIYHKVKNKIIPAYKINKYNINGNDASKNEYLYLNSIICNIGKANDNTHYITYFIFNNQLIKYDNININKTTTAIIQLIITDDNIVVLPEYISENIIGLLYLPYNDKNKNKTPVQNNDYSDLGKAYERCLLLKQNKYYNIRKEELIILHHKLYNSLLSEIPSNLSTSVKKDLPDSVITVQYPDTNDETYINVYKLLKQMFKSLDDNIKLPYFNITNLDKFNSFYKFFKSIYDIKFNKIISLNDIKFNKIISLNDIKFNNIIILINNVIYFHDDLHCSFLFNDEKFIKSINADIIERSLLVGGSKQYEINEINEINEIYDYYYKIDDNNEIINDLLEIFSNDSSFIISLLYLIINNEIIDINIIFKNFINDIQLLLNDLYESDVLLINNYGVDEIIFYVFMIYVYNRFNDLLSLSKKDIKITIKNDKLKLNIIENYHNIYKKLNEYFNGNEKYKFINYLKKYLKINYEKPANNSKYLLSFIYNNNSLIEGYDSFLTFAYINILNKVTPFFNINGNKYENTLPTLDIYDFSDMKNIKLKMTQKQEKIVSNLLKDNKTLLILLLKRYEPRFITKRNTRFILNKEILDYLSKKPNDFLNPMPIIDFDKYLNNDNNDNNNDDNNDIETNLFYYASREPSNNIYAKLIKYYLIGQRKRLNNKLLEFSLFQICNINKYLDKSKIETKLIKELSNANIEIDLNIIKEFITPKCDIEMKEITVIELLNYYYKKISFDTMIRYLSKLYKYDNKNKLQNQIQDLIQPFKLIQGGDGETITTDVNAIINDKTITTQQSTAEITAYKNPSRSSRSIDQLLPNDTISNIEDNIKKIIYIFENKLINIEELKKTFDKTIEFKIYEIGKTIISDLNEKIKRIDNSIRENNTKRTDITTSIDKTLNKIKNLKSDRNTNSTLQDNLTSELYTLEQTKKKITNQIDILTTQKETIETGNENILKILNKTGNLEFKETKDYASNSEVYTDIIGLVRIISIIPDDTMKEHIKYKFEAKKDELKNLNTIFESKKTDFETKIKTKLDNSKQILKDFFNIISQIPDLDDGIIKNLKIEYMKINLLGENDKDPVIIIDRLEEINTEIIKKYIAEIQKIIKVYDMITSSIEESINKKRGGKADKADKDYFDYTGGGNIDDINDFINEIKNKKKNVLNDLNNISTKLKKIKANRETNKNIETKMASVGFLDNEGSNMFDRLMTTYDDNIKNKNMPYEVARNLFYSKAKNLNLDPSEELEITQNDKIIFCVVIYIIRLLTLYICYILIDNNKFTALTSVLQSYVLWYIIILLIFVVIINIDAFKLRILVNYLNMHINSFGIMVHIILMLIFVYLIYLMTLNILGDDQPSLELSENEKIKLKYKLELLTIIIFIFICILVFII